MGKRGPKPYVEGESERVISFAEIAKRLNVSPRTVFSDYRKAVRKLKAIPGAFQVILSAHQMVAEANEKEWKDVLQPGSIECRKGFAETWGH